MARPRKSTVRSAVLPTKWAASPKTPTVDLPAERAVGVATKKPAAKPVVAPKAAPTRNLVEPSPTGKLSPRRPQSDRGSVAQPPEAPPPRAAALYWRKYAGNRQKRPFAPPPRRRRRAALAGRRSP